MISFLDQIKNLNPSYDRWLSPRVEYCVETIPPFMENGNEDCKVNYVLNSYNMRCEEFEKNKVLFAGCEYTMPIHQEIKDGWAYQVYEKMFKNDSKYIALSYPGSSLDRIVNNIFKYIGEYGNPEYIFVLAPEINRATGFFVEENIYKPKIYRQFSMDSGKEHNAMAAPNNLPLQIMILNYISSIRNLEIYCKNSNIQLIWTSWDMNTNNLLQEYEFNNYIKVDRNFINNFEISNLFIENVNNNVTLK